MTNTAGVSNISPTVARNTLDRMLFLFNSEFIFIDIFLQIQLYVGDGVCDQNDNCTNCSQDCGDCSMFLILFLLLYL